MSGGELYSNWYQCAKCERPCENRATTNTERQLLSELGLPAIPSVSRCCSSPVVVKSTPYIVGTPLPARNIAASREREV